MLYAHAWQIGENVACKAHMQEHLTCLPKVIMVSTCIGTSHMLGRDACDMLQAAAEEAKPQPNMRKSVASSVMPAASTKTPSYMKSTQTHTTRTSLGGAADTDARFTR